MVAGTVPEAGTHDARWKQWLKRFRAELGRLRRQTDDE